MSPKGQRLSRVVVALMGAGVAAALLVGDGAPRPLVPAPADVGFFEMSREDRRTTFEQRRSRKRRPFDLHSPWNRRIPRRPDIASRSRAIARYLGRGPRGSVVANLYRFGVPIFRATANTNRVRVRCTRPWGRCKLENRKVPMPRGARPSRGSDHAMVVRTRKRSFEFWRASKARRGWKTAWGGSARISAWGRSRRGRLPTGAGVSRLAGIVTVKEMRARRVKHALVFSTDNACDTRYRYPAAKTDGTSRRRNCIPLGARIQLKPWVKLRGRGLNPGERVVARALKRYGAYAVDSGGARMAFIFETPIGQKDPYKRVGFRYDYYDMPHIPWKRIRVLRQWNGG